MGVFAQNGLAAFPWVVQECTATRREAEAMPEMYCPQCGAENADNRTLCKRCRKPLAVKNAASAAWLAVRRLRRR